MDQERWKKIESLFESALVRGLDDRQAFLDQACAGDETLRQEVESLLAHHQPTGRFIPTLVHEAARLLPEDKAGATGAARFIPGTVLARRYRIIDMLGKGGMGEVYRADDLKLTQPVALKFLPEKLSNDRNMLERFHREVRIARQVSHPNICRVFDIGEVGDQHFLSMEYIDGEDLASLLRRIGRLPADKAVEIASQLCGGLAAAHQEGVLHRDLKPANVMIDGRGRAKITDFGLAGLADEFEGHELRAGTPAYMAPEQLAGKEVSIKSDIYSLGLLLYELFTGKKAYSATTLEDLVRERESSAPPSLSEHIKEIDPLVERVILRCLERDPDNRPASVTQVAAALPGGDPLAAAIAAGETPSPEMVAAAPKEGALRPAVALACLTGIIALLAFFVLTAGKFALQNLVPLDKSPEVLTDQASRIIKQFGYTEPAVDTAYGFDTDRGYLNYLRSPDVYSQALDKLPSGQPALIHFWYRQSPRYLETLSSGSVSLADPPLDVSNMAKVVLDTQGRLLEFAAVPPQIDTGNPVTTPDWADLFTAAGLAMDNFTRVDSTWVPPVNSDARVAWEGTYPNQPDSPIRIEAAAYRGKPAYFQIISPWQKPLRQQEVTPHSGRKAAAILLTTIFFTGLLVAVLLARRNFKLGRGDRKGAFKIALFGFSVYLLGALVDANHVPTLAGELAIVYKAAGGALIMAVVLWVIYIALEPYVRRRWPKLIISWSRLLAGGFRDPMVGRDILIGGLCGLGHTLSIYSSVVIPQFFGLAPTGRVAGLIGGVPLAHGLRARIAEILSNSFPGSILVGLGFLFLVLLLYVLFRKQWLAAAGLWALQFIITGLAFIAGGPWYGWLSVVMVATIYAVAAVRFGLLTLVSLQLFFELSYHTPLTSRFSAWHAGPTIFVLVTMIGLAVYGFYTSRAGQPLLRMKMLQD